MVAEVELSFFGAWFSASSAQLPGFQHVVMQSPQSLRPVIICMSAEAGFWISPMLVYPPGKSDGNAAASNDLIPLPVHWNHKRLPSLNIAERDLWLISISPISAVGGTALNRNYTKWI